MCGFIKFYNLRPMQVAKNLILKDKAQIWPFQVFVFCGVFFVVVFFLGGGLKKK